MIVLEEKKEHVLACGVRLFARKGYHKTSIDEIAKEAGISKGAFYLYFPSKESFVVAAFTMFQTQINEKIDWVERKNLPPKESFSEQITCIIKHMYTYKDFLLMYFQEDISIGDETIDLVYQMKQSNVDWLHKQLQEIYGRNIKRIIYDVIVMFEGIFAAYMRWIIIEQANVSFEKVGPFIIERLDEMVGSMIVNEAESLLTELPKMNNASNGRWWKDNLEQTVKELRLIEIPKEANKDELTQVLKVLEAELLNERTQPAIIRGLLAQLKTFSVYESICAELTSKLALENIITDSK